MYYKCYQIFILFNINLILILLLYIIIMYIIYISTFYLTLCVHMQTHRTMHLFGNMLLK